MKILIADNIDEIGIQLINAEPEFTADVKTSLTPDELGSPTALPLKPHKKPPLSHGPGEGEFLSAARKRIAIRHRFFKQKDQS